MNCSVKKNSEFYMELSKLIRTIPAPASVVFDVITYKKACGDYQTALFYVGEILSNHATYEKWKSQLGKGTVDDDFILQCKDNMETNMEKLRSFIKERSEEGWE